MPSGDPRLGCVPDGVLYAAPRPTDAERLDAILTVARKHGAVEIDAFGVKATLAPIVKDTAQAVNPHAELEAAFARVAELKGRPANG